MASSFLNFASGRYQSPPEEIRGLRPLSPTLSSEPYCYLTTSGRRSGEPHTIEVWFALEGETLYMLAGGRERSDWVRNLSKAPGVTVRIAATTFAGSARAVAPLTEEDALARRLLLRKYATSSNDLAGWGRSALPIAVDLDRVVSTDMRDAKWPKGRRFGG